MDHIHSPHLVPEKVNEKQLARIEKRIAPAKPSRFYPD